MLSYFQLSNVFIYGKLTGHADSTGSVHGSSPLILYFCSTKNPLLAICTNCLFCLYEKNSHSIWICAFLRFSVLKIPYREYLRKVLCTFFEIYSTNLSSANRLTIYRIVVNFLSYFFPMGFLKDL